MALKKKLIAVDEYIHDWISDAAKKAGQGVQIIDVMRHLHSLHKDDLNLSDYSQVKLQMELEKLNQRKRAIIEEERKLMAKIQHRQDGAPRG